MTAVLTRPTPPFPIVQRPHAANMVRFGEAHPEVLVLSADLTSSCEVNDFRDTLPDQFYSMGMGEANMMGAAAGLAREGLRPHVHTFAVFVTRRPFDQVSMSIAYPNLPVRLLGFLPGVTTPGGVTHQAIDDVALMRTLPNMTILTTGDATEVESILDVAHAVDGPVYLRMLRGRVPRLFPANQPMELGRARLLADAGDDLTLITTGIETEQALRLTPHLLGAGIALRHLHVSTLKPFDDPAVLKAVTQARVGVVTAENHSVIGGLGSAVAEAMAERGARGRLVRVGMPDVYGHGASREYLMREYGLDAAGIGRAVERLLGVSLDLPYDALAAGAAPAAVAAANAANAEDL